MKTTSLIYIAAVVSLFPAAVFAQQAVHDATTHALVSKGNADYLARMAESFKKMDEQLKTLENTFEQVEKIVSLKGDPKQALETIGGLGQLGDLTSSIQTSSAFRLGKDIAKNLDGNKSLEETGRGIYRSVSKTLQDGTAIERDVERYKKFAAHEAEQENFDTVLEEAQDERVRLLNELDRTVKRIATSDADEQAKQTKIVAIHAALQANDTKVRDANDQRQSRAEANENDAAKQDEAEKEAVSQLELKGIQEAQDPGYRR